MDSEIRRKLMTAAAEMERTVNRIRYAVMQDRPQNLPSEVEARLPASMYGGAVRLMAEAKGKGTEGGQAA